MTVKDLKEYCEKEISKGNGNRIVFTADDEEGNGFHQIPYFFCDDKELLETAIEGTNYKANEIIILG